MTLIRFNILPPIKFQATQTGIGLGPRGLSAYEVYLAETSDDPPLTDAQWLLSLVGAAGTDGREVQLQLSATHVQWRYVGDVAWTNLVAITDITGPQGIQGIQGIPGTEIELQLSSTHIQWHYVGEGTWNDLISIDDITGPQGIQGIQGIPGTEIELQNNGTYIQWRYQGGSWTNLVALSALIGPQGPQGTEVELNVSATHIQWRYVGDITWIDLIAIDDITGPQGVQGIQGIPGTEIELQNNGTYIQWRYQGGAWSNLVSLAAITGPQGNSGSSYTLDFQTAVTIMSDLNLEGAITITDIIGLNVATLKLNNVSQALGSGLTIQATNQQVLTWEITRTTTGMAALGIKFTRN